MLSRLFKRLLKLSLAGRFLLVMIALVVSTQLIVNQLWENQTRSELENALGEVSLNMALRVSSTVEYFVALPTQYRQIVLNQLRYMGGTRYFVTLNSEYIDIEPYENSQVHQIIIDAFRKTLKENIKAHGEISIAFSQPQTLHVLNNDTLLKDLPDRWRQENLIINDQAPPVLVIQIQVTPEEWLYLATLLPDSAMMSPDLLTQPLKFSYLIWMLILLGIASLLIRSMTHPFARLSLAAKAFGRDLKPVPIPESGCQEYETTARAFNHMQQNIRHYINDRKRLFSGISHDLKTPITRLRLRTEMLDDDNQRDALNEDLDHLEMMVKSALQTLSDTDIHENPEGVNLGSLLYKIASTAESVGQSVVLRIEKNVKVIGKPLALMRCLENIIGNAITYGKQANIHLFTVPRHVIIEIRDHGPGLPEGMEEQIFQPYLRLPHGRECNPDGNGLGLITARHLAHIHGGSLKLRNHPEGGLEVILKLPADT